MYYAHLYYAPLRKTKGNTVMIDVMLKGLVSWPRSAAQMQLTCCLIKRGCDIKNTLFFPGLSDTPMNCARRKEMPPRQRCSESPFLFSVTKPPITALVYIVRKRAGSCGIGGAFINASPDQMQPCVLCAESRPICPLAAQR